MLSMTGDERATLYNDYFLSSYDILVNSYITPDEIQELDRHGRYPICMFLVINRETPDLSKFKLSINLLCLKDIRLYDLSWIRDGLLNLKELQIHNCMWGCSKLNFDWFPSLNYMFKDFNFKGGAKIRFPPPLTQLKANCTVKNDPRVQDISSGENDILLCFGPRLVDL
jgi:hypothetical protein